MKATFSPSTGYYIVGGDGRDTVHLLSAVTMTSLDPVMERAGLSLTKDWRVLEFEDEHSGLIEAKHLAMTARCVALARLRLMVVDGPTGSALYPETEDLISSYASPDYVLQELLIAPYVNIEPIRRCADDALSQGFGAVGNLFARLLDLQPLLRRLSSIWLQLPLEPFFNADASKQELWNRLRTSGNLLKLLEAPNRHVVVEIFGALAFEQSIPRNRLGITRLGNAIANGLFGKRGLIQVAQEVYSDDSPEYGARGRASPRQRGGLERALKEIDGITNAVANGDDNLAEKYLQALIQRQTAELSDRAHAVKSLCNLAKQCADMLRADFEQSCLIRARDIDPSDSWTMIQLGDHLKRVGLYAEAREIVQKSLSIEQSEVGQSLLADIDSQTGEYELAIERYTSIAGWRRSSAIRTAVADNLRRLGRLDEADAAYKAIEEEGLGTDRSIAGRAEIAKQLGQLDLAKSLYSALIGSIHKRERSWWVYRIAFAGILKQRGEYQDALAITEDIIATVPFAMHARVLRASLWGLLELADKGLAALPDVQGSYAYTAYGEWVREFTRGLLLLRTERYRDAYDRLSRNLAASVLDAEERTILRLAGALALVADGRIANARALLTNTSAARSAYVRHLNEVLQYHISVAESDIEGARSLYESLSRKKDENVLLWRAVQALHHGDMKKAIRFEIDAMLSLAA
jgi:hypothetical protein